MKLYIKNMVCHRCRLAVTDELKKIGLHPISIALGEVSIEENKLTEKQIVKLAESLKVIGFELIDDKQSKLIEQVKTFIIEKIHHKAKQPLKKFSQLLSKNFLHDYSYISNLFSQVEGITIEQYVITQKIEKVKELLLYNELSLSQIALELDYSSTAHLSAQFKKMTGFTPTKFKQLGAKGRKSLDDVGKK